jgi:SSS family solute:Na+ symporter
LFQCLRAFSTGVTVYGISIVIQKLLGIPFWVAVLLLGAITVVYDFLGGIRAVIYSDVVQMIVLYTGVAVCLVYAIELCGGWGLMWEAFPADKAKSLDFSGHGYGDGKTFAFWPMLIGGFFLYLSYYGCDQTQVQRELSTRSVDDTNMSLFMNGILRFPLVVTYCLVGVALSAFLVKNPSFKDLLLDQTGQVNYNLAVPTFCLQYLPHGVIGIIIVALFAAAMSSLDSTINSLSAVTIRDLVERFLVSGTLDGERQLRWSRFVTVFWGIICIVFSFFVGGISKSIIESINKLSSLMNGPILGTFMLAILTRKANDKGTFVGILSGFLANLYFWAARPEISWLWWNLIGFAVTYGVGYAVSLTIGTKAVEADIDALVYHKDSGTFLGYRKNWTGYYAILVGYFFVMILILGLIGH